MKKLLLSLLVAVMSVTAWAYTYTKVTSAPQDWSGTYVLVGNGNGDGKTYAFNGEDVVNGHTEVTISDGAISSYTGVTLLVATLQDGGYSVKVVGGTNDGKYISSGSSAPSYSNALKFNAEPHRVDFSMNNGNVVMSQSTTSGNVTMRFNYASDQLRFRFYKSGQQPVQLYKQDAGAGVAVTGVSLDKASATIVVDEQTTLTATVAPANADNKSVTWTSSNEAVATVDNGVVSGVSVGSATITVSTRDGNFTATCNVTVNAKPATVAGIIYKWDGTGSTSEAIQIGGAASVPIESSSNMVAGSSQKGNYCFKMNKGVSSSGGPFVILVTFNEPLKKGDVITGAVFRAAETVATLGIDFLAAGATANPSYKLVDPQVLDSNGTPEDNITYTVPESADGSKTIRLYRNSGSTGLYVSKFVVTRPVANISVSDAKYSTYYNNDLAYTMPEGLNGYVFTAANGLELAYEANDVVPAGEPLVLAGEAGKYTLHSGVTSEETYKSAEMNDLCGAATDMTAQEMADANPGTNYFYALVKHNGQVGFWWKEDEGAAFAITAGKAYLVLPQSLASDFRGFSFEDLENGNGTGINELNNDSVDRNIIYNIQGQRIETVSKNGFYIVNNRIQWLNAE